MKKSLLFFLAAAMVAIAACEKPDEPTPDPGTDPGTDPVTTEDVLTLTSDSVVTIGAESEIVTIKFTTNTNWTASSEEDFVVLNNKSGEAGDIELKATLQSLPEEELGRTAAVKIVAGKKDAEVIIFQGKVFIINPDELYVDVAGGEVSFTVTTNLEYSVKTYDSFDWAPATFDKEKGEGTFKVAKNNGYDTRYAYVKFTGPAIQFPVYDEETGEPTGETEDAVYRVYVFQNGNMKSAWGTILDESFNVGDGATASVALFGGKLLVSDAAEVHVVDPATGKFEGTLDTGDLPVQSITSDDAGNLLLANLGEYGALYDVYAVKADDSKLENPVHLIHCVVDAWNGSASGVDKVAARGDVFGDGVVTAMYGGVPSYGGIHYGLYWSINDGKAAEQEYNEWNPIVNQPDGGWFPLPVGGDDIWLSNRAAFIPAGPSLSDGFFFGGYDGTYSINYYDGAAWNVSIEEAGNWGGGPQGMETIEWNGKKILAFIQMGYMWWSEGWGMPAYVWVVDVTDPTAPEVLSCSEYYGGDDQLISGDTENSTVDVILAVESGDLCVYAVDTSHGCLAKLLYPVL